MMKRFTIFMLLLVLVFTAACGGAQPTPEAEESGDEAATEAEDTASEEGAAGGDQVVTIGFTASNTGKLEVSSAGQTRGFQLWMDSVADGITLSDGTVITFDSVSYDDESKKERVQQLYTKLINEDNADFLISPYSSGLTDASAFITEEYGKVLITTGAASDETYKKGFQSVYQLYTPASRYLTGAIDFLADQDPDAKKIAFVYENAKFSTDVVNEARAYAEEQGYEVVLTEGYDPETTDFAPFINKITANEPDAIMGGGHFNDGTSFARQLENKQVDVNAIVLLVAPPELKFAELGEAALGVIGPSQWEPKANYTEEAAEESGLEWYGTTGEEFVEQYTNAHSEEPSYHAAGGYAAGLVLQKAIEEADSVDEEAIKEVMDAMDILTFYGHIKFNTTEEAHGLQEAHDMVYIQWQEDDEGNLVKEVVWPPEGKSAEPLYPVP